MPKRKAVRGRKGGGITGRKNAKAATVENEEAEVKTDLNSSQEAADDIVIEDSGTEHSIDEDLSFKQDGTECILDTEMSELHKDGDMEDEQCDGGLSKENPDQCVKTAAKQIEQFEKAIETGPFEKKISSENVGTESGENVETGEKILLPEESKEIDQFEETIGIESKDRSLEDDTALTVKDNQAEEWPVTKLLEDELLASVENTGNKEGMGAELNLLDKEVEDDQKEMEEIQYIDEEAGEDQQLSDIMESISSDKTDVTQHSESLKESDTVEQSENQVDLSQSCEVSADIVKHSAVDSQKNEDIDDSKFEEISEGSIDQDHEELNAEPISDVEITGESFVPKKTQNSEGVNVQAVKTNFRYKEAESLEEVFFATENDDVKITAEDKDNDDISDASLSDHADANLSLEEISDDDLEPSKKRRKPTGTTPIKTEKTDENTKTDGESVNISDEKSEGVKTNQISVSLAKRPANDDTGGNEGNASKRFKTSNETKGNEEPSSRSEVDQVQFIGESKKEGKKSQARESDVSHGRNALHKRNLSQSSKNEQQESRERSISSREIVEHRSRFELVSSSCQTEPRRMKGKIVQCNINPIQPVKHLEIISETTVTQLLTKFKNQLPASIPERVFSQVTSLQQPRKENTFSFSMGPVTLSDMDCPKFRAVLRGAEEFSLAFDRHYQGILKASVAKHESLASLIRQLKCLELGNRYMVMSVVHKYGSETSVGVWKATLLFMYEQDIQMESQSLVNDGKIRAKLKLRGVPKGVSKDFIHLLFPEAINVGTGQGTVQERDVTLGFSNTKMVEEIISCHDLLIIGGSQIYISHLDSPDAQHSLSADITEESGVVIIEDTEHCDEMFEISDICVNLEQDTDFSQQNVLEPRADSNTKIEIEASKENKDSKQQDQLKQGDGSSEYEAAGLSGNLADVQVQENKDQAPEQSESLLEGTSSCMEDAQTAAETNVTEISCMAALSTEGVEINISNIQENDSVKKTAIEVIPLSIKESNEVEGPVIVISDEVEDSMCNEIVDVDKPLDSSLVEADITTNVVTVDISLLESDKMTSETTDEEVSKSEDNIQDNAIPDIVLLISPETTSICEAAVLLDEASRETSEEKISEIIIEEVEVNAVDNEVNNKTNDENLEDVSDEEMISQNKREDLQDVVILREDSSQWVAANIDLTNDESNVSGKVLNESLKDIKEEKSHQISNISDSKAKTASGNSDGKHVNAKLVMTDGGLEISMEVIDVDEGNQEVDKVIYARTWRQSRDMSRERNTWGVGNSHSTPYVHMPWKDTQWPQANKSDAYHSLREPYKHHSVKVSRHYPTGRSREASPNYRVPARESTAQRRDTYYPKHRSYSYRSPSPKRDVNLHGHSSTHAPDHRTSTTEHWDRRYENWRPNTYGDSRRTESYSRPPAESSSRPAHWQSRSTAYHSTHAWHEDQHVSTKSGDHHSYSASRAPHYSERRHDYRKSRSRSLSDMSISSSEKLLPVRRSSYRRESPKRSVLHASRSPISVSSRSRSLSPVSKSPSVEYSHTETGKEELVKTVKHFLELAKGIQQATKRRTNRSRSPKSPALRQSKSPLPLRLNSPPHMSGSHARKGGRSSRHAEAKSPHRMRSRSRPPSWPRKSRSPSYTRSQRYKYERSPSRSSHGGNYKKHYGDRSYADKKGSLRRRDSRSPERRYESKRSQKAGPYDEQSSRSKSGQWSETKYKSSSDQPLPQSFGGYQPSQSSGAVSTGNLYNPSYPPPGCPPPQPSSMYSGSSMPVYQYSNQSQYNYPSIPPPCVNVPPPPIGQSYQSSYSAYQTPQPYVPTGHHNAPPQTSTSGGVRSSNSSSKNKKSWSMGGNAMGFQRVLGHDSKGGKKSKCGVIEKIEDRKRLERPKYTKPERVLATVQMEKKQVIPFRYLFHA